MYLCMYHNYDGDLRGWSRSDRFEPELGCQACRWESVRRQAVGLKPHFSIEEILEFEAEHPEQWRPTWDAAQVVGREPDKILEFLRSRIQEDQEDREF